MCMYVGICVCILTSLKHKASGLTTQAHVDADGNLRVCMHVYVYMYASRPMNPC
jgi:hypothetical protein